MNALSAIALDESGARWVIALVVQVTVAALLALFASAVLRRDAAGRHALLAIGLIAIVTAPLTAWLCDRTGWTVFEIAVVAHRSPDSDESRDSGVRLVTESPVVNAVGPSTGLSEDSVPRNVAFVHDAHAEPSNLSGLETAVAHDRTTATTAGVESVGAESTPRRWLTEYPARIPLAIWGVGCLFFLARMVYGGAVVRRLCRQATEVDGSRYPAVEACVDELFAGKERSNRENAALSAIRTPRPLEGGGVGGGGDTRGVNRRSPPPLRPSHLEGGEKEVANRASFWKMLRSRSAAQPPQRKQSESYFSVQVSRTTKDEFGTGESRGNGECLRSVSLFPLLAPVQDFLRLRQVAAPRILVSDHISTAAAVGLIHPAILLPRSYLDDLSADDLRDVLTHEAAHILRRDHWIGLLQRLAEALYRPHPLVHLLNRRLSRAREEICDNYVLQRTEAPRFAGLLLRLVEASQPQPMPAESLALLNGRWKLEERIAGLLDPRRLPAVACSRRRLAFAAALMIASGILAGGLRFTNSTENLVAGVDAPPATPAANAAAGQATVATAGAGQQAAASAPTEPLFRLGSLGFRHEGWHKEVRYAADGRILVSASETSMKFWDARSGDLLRETSLHESIHRAMRVSADGKRVATLGTKLGAEYGIFGNHWFRLWDVESGALVSEFVRPRTRPGEKSSMALSPDGMLAIVGDSVGYVELFELATGNRLLEYHIDLGDIGRIDFSPDGKRLAIAMAYSQRVYLWDWAAGDAPVKLDSGRRFQGVAFSPDGRLLAVGADGGTDVRLWDLTTRTLLHSLEDVPQTSLHIEELAFTPDSTKLLAANPIRPTAGFVAAVLAWDVKSGKLLRRFEAKGMHPRSLSISPDGSKVASVDWDAAFRVWDIATGEPAAPVPAGHAGMVRSVAFTPSSRQIITVSEDHTVRLWDAGTGRETARLDHSETLYVQTQSPDGRLLATAGVHDTITLWETSPVRKIREIKGGRSLGGAQALWMKPDRNELLVSQDNLTLRVYGIADGATKREFSIRPSGIDFEAIRARRGQPGSDLRESALDIIAAHLFTTDGAKLVLVGKQGGWWVFDTATGKEIARHAKRFADFRVTAALSTDGRRMALAGEMREATDVAGQTVERISKLAVFDFDSGKIVWQTERKPAFFTGVGFSNDGRTLATALVGENRNGIELYDVATGELKHVISGGRSTGWSNQGFAFSKDDTRLSAVQSDSTVLGWDLTALPKLTRK